MTEDEPAPWPWLFYHLPSMGSWSMLVVVNSNRHNTHPYALLLNILMLRYVQASYGPKSLRWSNRYQAKPCVGRPYPVVYYFRPGVKLWDYFHKRRKMLRYLLVLMASLVCSRKWLKCALTTALADPKSYSHSLNLGEINKTCQTTIFMDRRKTIVRFAKLKYLSYKKIKKTKCMFIQSRGFRYQLESAFLP